MGNDNRPCVEDAELRPVVGLTRGLMNADLELLTIDAIREHRRLSARAEVLFHDLPEEYRSGRKAGGDRHRAYVKAMIQMHAQMAALSTLLCILGYTPAVPED